MKTALILGFVTILSFTACQQESSYTEPSPVTIVPKPFYGDAYIDDTYIKEKILEQLGVINL